MPVILITWFISQEIKLYRRSESAGAEKCSSDAATTNLRVKKNKAVQSRQQSAVKVTFHNEAKASKDDH